MKNMKKGFTIVELVIVIAIIAILAAVLIPTFGTVIKNANHSSALQAAKNAMTIVTMKETADGSELDDTYYVVSGEYVFKYDKNNGLKDMVEAADEGKYCTLKYTGEKVAALKALEGKTYTDTSVTPNVAKNIIVKVYENTILDANKATGVTYVDNADIGKEVRVYKVAAGQTPFVTSGDSANVEVK